MIFIRCYYLVSIILDSFMKYLIKKTNDDSCFLLDNKTLNKSLFMMRCDKSFFYSFYVNLVKK